MGMGGHAPPPNIPGVKQEGALVQTLKREVSGLLGRDQLTFPGAQPVSFAARHLLELQKQDYYVCEKSDGIRCLMYMTNDGPNEIIYLIDRKNDYYWVQNLHFPLPGEEQLFHTGTLLDGELVNDTEGNGTIQLKYLVFDCMALDGASLMPRTLDKRLGYYHDKVYTPYRDLYTKYPEEIQYLPFIMEAKKMEVSYGMELMFRDILPNLPHGNDGLIFTCRNSPYRPGTDPHIMKWKKENENSIDFLLNLQFPLLQPDLEDEADGITEPYPDYLAMPIFHLSVMGDSHQYIPYGQMYVEPSEWESMKALGEPLDDRIVECFQDRQGRWRYMRWRDDKKEPNHISTVESVIESIQDRISEKDLIGNSKKVRDEWKRRQAEAEAAARQAKLSVSGLANGQQRELSPAVKRKAEDGTPAELIEAQRRKVT